MITKPLVEVIAEHLAEWDTSPAYVELAIYGTDDPALIAHEIDRFCRRQLGAGVAGGLFHQSSIGSVSGVVLEDERPVVLKAHQPDHTIEFLHEVVRIQKHLESLYATTVIAGPAPLRMGHAVVEKFDARGALANGHDPAIRRALAESLHAIARSCQPLVASSTLPRHVLTELPPERLWPVPHSKLFDFEATAKGAEAMDELARAARARMNRAGDPIIGHGDWRVEHVRFEGTTPVIAFDWDSLFREDEPALVGFAAHGFCANWNKGAEGAPSPTLDEARQFVADYEASRGRAFTRSERAFCGGAFAYACAYTARCAHAVGSAGEPGSFGALVLQEGLRLLDL